MTPVIHNNSAAVEGHSPSSLLVAPLLASPPQPSLPPNPDFPPSVCLASGAPDPVATCGSGERPKVSSLAAEARIEAVRSGAEMRGWGWKLGDGVVVLPMLFRSW